MNETEMQALLNQLETVQLPDVSRLPAPGWFVLVFVGFICILLVRYLVKRRNRRLWLREARAELARLREQLEQQAVAQTLSETSRLARQVLIVARGRQAVASLHGKSWLDALDEVCARPVFAHGFGQLLEAGPYQRNPQVSSDSLHSLLDAVEELIGAAARVTQRPAS